MGWGSATAVGRKLAQEGFGQDVGWGFFRRVGSECKGTGF